MSVGPNILFIQTDQLTVDVLGCYGAPLAKTPNLDRLVESGVVFERAYCNYPLCAPSRASMATGKLASNISAFDNGNDFASSTPTYAHYLGAMGYRTCLSGKMHFVGPDQHHGFERRVTSDIYPGDFTWSADWSKIRNAGNNDMRILTVAGPCARSVQIDYDNNVTHCAIQEIYDCAKPTEERPFFLQVSYSHPHDPYLCQPKHWDLYENDDLPLPRTGPIAEQDNDPHSLRLIAQYQLDHAKVSDEMMARARRAYCGSVSYIDDQIGLLLDALEQSGQRDNTIIVFTTDHGEMLGERGLWLKKTFFEASARVPLIINAPERLAPGRVSTVCSLVDLLPTFAQFAADGQWQGPVEPIDGDDLTEFVQTEDPDRLIVSELLCEGLTAPAFMLRQGAFKAIFCDGDPDQLFDLDADPHERHNLATDPRHQQILEQFKVRVARLWDKDRIKTDIETSQQRRKLIKQAHANGSRPDWDLAINPDDSERYCRNRISYNDWAFDYLKPPH